jgi:hypothetical protein
MLNSRKNEIRQLLFYQYVIFVNVVVVVAVYDYYRYRYQPIPP